MTEAAFSYPGLPKWPQMRVSGHSVTPEQASEIIRRTDTFFTGYGGGNDKHWNRFVKGIVKMPLGLDDERRYEPGAKVDWQAEYAAEAAWKEAWGCIETEYVHNSWISCAFIGGPHGWCSPMGTIYYRDNVGKWPSAEDVEKDWRKLSTAFPFLDLEAVLMSGEGCEDNGEPVIGFIVKDGSVTPKLPSEHRFGQGEYAWSNIGQSLEQQMMALLTMPSRSREAGIPEHMIRKWAADQARVPA
jgi:hypothetical protein